METFETQNVIGLGTGIYTLADVAGILRLPTAKVRRWMREYWNLRFGSPAQSPFSYGSGRHQVTNFLTLIEFFTFYQLRSHGVSAQSIVKAHRVLEKTYKTKYPFAKSNILTDGKRILFNDEIGQIIQADETLQMTIKEVFEPFCKKVEFNDEDIVNRFFPMGRDHSIVIDPRRQFGQPIIDGTNILAENIYRLHLGGETLETITYLFELTADQVKDAINYYHREAA